MEINVFSLGNSISLSARLPNLYCLIATEELTLKPGGGHDF